MKMLRHYQQKHTQQQFNYNDNDMIIGGGGSLQQSRIPQSLQTLFVVASRGNKELHQPPPRKLASHRFGRWNNNGIIVQRRSGGSKTRTRSSSFNFWTRKIAGKTNINTNSVKEDQDDYDEEEEEEEEEEQASLEEHHSDPLQQGTSVNNLRTPEKNHNNNNKRNRSISRRGSASSSITTSTISSQTKKGKKATAVVVVPPQIDDDITLFNGHDDDINVNNNHSENQKPHEQDHKHNNDSKNNNNNNNKTNHDNTQKWHVSTQDYFDSMLRTRGYSTQTYPSLNTAYYNHPTPLQRASYGMEIMDAVRTNRVQQLRKLLQIGILSPNACNEFGESIVHMACRYGHYDCLRLLIIEFGATIRICDDTGRNPFHDACSSLKFSHDVAILLLQQDKDLLLLQDRHGATPLSYLKPDQWTNWTKFLMAQKDNFWPYQEQQQYVPLLCQLPPNSHPVPCPVGTTGTNNTERKQTPKTLIHIELAQMVASGRMTPMEAMLIMDDDENDNVDGDEEEFDETNEDPEEEDENSVSSSIESEDSDNDDLNDELLAMWHHDEKDHYDGENHAAAEGTKNNIIITSSSSNSNNNANIIDIVDNTITESSFALDTEEMEEVLNSLMGGFGRFTHNNSHNNKNDNKASSRFSTKLGGRNCSASTQQCSPIIAWSS